MCVPLTVRNTELAGRTSKLLAFVNTYTTQPAYRDIPLNGKLARDTDSVEMLDIIFDSLVCDFGLNYLGFNDLTYTIPHLVAVNKSSDFGSWYAKNAKKVQSSLDEIYSELIR